MPHETCSLQGTGDEFARWMLSQRGGRSGSPQLLPGGADVGGVEVESTARATVTRAIEAFKATMAEVDYAALKNRGVVPTEMVHKARHSYMAFCRVLNEVIGDASSERSSVKVEVGIMAQREVLPYILLTDNAERWYAKPRGYAGDFCSVEKVYEDRASGAGRLGPLLDRCFLDLPAMRGIRNRRRAIAREIRGILALKAGGETKVTSLVCGGAREIFDVYAKLSRPSALTTTLIDMDLHALAHVSTLCERMRLSSRMTLLQENLLVLSRGAKKIELTDQDLVYSLGFIEYFNDTLVVRLLDWIHGLLRPGGRVLLGSFHPDNPCKALMAHVFGWKPVHRTEADMDRLFSMSAFGCPSTRLFFEEQRVSFFAECVKAPW
jgi:extracellular factor (EF) 3-hydroxypalmitic acid methyl ester biosynthesis protein